MEKNGFDDENDYKSGNISSIASLVYIECTISEYVTKFKQAVILPCLVNLSKIRNNNALI